MTVGRRWGHRIDVSVDAETREALDRLAEIHETSLAQQVRVAISHYLAMKKQRS